MKRLDRPRSTSLNVLVTVGNVAAVLGNFIFSALLDVEYLVGIMGIGCLLFGKSPVEKATRDVEYNLTSLKVSRFLKHTLTIDRVFVSSFVG